MNFYLHLYLGLSGSNQIMQPIINTVKDPLKRNVVIYSIFLPPILAVWIHIQIQDAKSIWIHMDPDPKH